MSVLASAQETAGPSDNAEEYHQKLLLHAHTILNFGYRLINSWECGEVEEEDITGALSEAMNDFLASPDAPPWRTFYAVHEEPRVRNKGRRGKRRLRLDIQIEYTGGQRPRFSFEAKRLRESDVNSIGKYFGGEGLGCFISGQYASESGEAGMLAYIQSNDPSHWSSAIHAGLKRRVKKCEWDAQKGWTAQTVAEGLEWTFKSTHSRSSTGREIVIYHTILSFVAGSPQAPETPDE